MRTPEELTERFRRRGLKVTPQRRAVFELLHENAEHPSADAVFAAVRERMPTISLRTVYQTLNDLAAMGEIQALDLGTGSVRFDPNLDNHHHLVCTGCGAVTDIYADLSGLDLPVPEDAGFVVESTELVVRGRCRRCSGGSASSPPPAPSRHTHNPRRDEHA